METPIQKQDLDQTEDNIQTLRRVALELWSVCSPVHRSRWSGLSFWHSCEPAFKILLHLSTWIIICFYIPVDYYLSVHNSGKIYLQHHHWYYIYICIYTRYTFFWIEVYLWWRYLKFLLSILKLFVLADIKGSTS